MIQLLHTGAVEFEGVQPSAVRSIGGYISSSEMGNGSVNNLFDTLSKYTIQNNRPEVRVIAVKNVSGGTLSNFRMYLEYPADEDSNINDTLITVGIADPISDDCGGLYVPSIGNIYSVPPDITFNDIEGEVNTLPLGDFVNNDYIILYIKRVLKDSLQNPLSDEDLLSIFEGTLVLPKVEDTKIYFLWD